MADEARHRPHSDPTTDAPALTGEAERFWEQRYRDQAPRWSGRPNPVLVDVAGPLHPGRALDLGCGEGGDALWLAGRGWLVTAVDIAQSSVDRVRAWAERDRLADRVRTERHNLAHSLPTGEFDLVSAQYLHTPFELDRAQVLRAAAHLLVPGGLLLVVDHGSVAPWSWHQDAHFATPAEKFAELALDPDGWHAERLDAPQRTATGPDGQTATVTDHVLAVRRSLGQEKLGQEKRSGLNTSASTTSTL
ncbi:MAG TPA: methyltransferase domain-containing protein [Pseudonocardia sp.]|jgi:SAM-dependent methyltransferase|nr:methyltransferase domain-containing protein [Pseudonocardia sp.]